MLLPSHQGAAALFFFSTRGDTDSESEVESVSSLSIHGDNVFSSAEESFDSDFSDADNEQPTTSRFLNRPKLGRAYFLKSTQDREAASQTKAKPVKPTKPKREERKPIEKPKIEATPEEGEEERLLLSSADIVKRLNEILSLRGRKSVDKRDQVESLRELAEVAQKLELPSLEAHLKLQVVSAIFDIMVGQASASAMPQNLWQDACTLLNEALALAEEHEDVVLDSKTLTEENSEEVAEDQTLSMHLSLLPFVIKLEYELSKALQLIDYRADDYKSRVADEWKFLQLAERAQNYFDSRRMSSHSMQVALRRVEHLHFRTPNNEGQLLNFEHLIEWEVPENLTDLIQNLVRGIYVASKDRTKRDDSGEEFIMVTKAALYLVHHLALLGKFRQARDRFLMSQADRLFDSKNPLYGNSDVQILYNRCLAVLGVAAFKCGEFSDAHGLLNDLMSFGRIKEVLAQDKRRQVPYHIFLSIEVLEVVYYTCSMLLETPNAASAKCPSVVKQILTPNPSCLFNTADKSRRVISKMFRRHQAHLKRELFLAPPETPKDVVFECARLLENGDVTTAINLIKELSFWEMMSDAEVTLQFLEKVMREAALSCFLFNSLSNFSTITIEMLSEMFGLEPSKVLTIVSKNIVRGYLIARIDKVEGEWVVWCANHPPSDPLVLEVFNLAEKSQFLKDQAVAEPIA
ncbi:hypothetical protein P9112_002992 [Eukaryota sp. TZLM1-RC]